MAARWVGGGRVFRVRPRGLRQGGPVATRFEPPLEHERGLALLLRNQPDHVLAEARRDGLGVDVGDEPVLVGLEDLGFDRGAHTCIRPAPVAPKLIAYSHELQPRTICACRSTSAFSTSLRNRSSAAQNAE